MGKLKILVVEDEIIIADSICDVLEELGYEVLEPAISFTEAIETIEMENPDLAFLDIQLSGKKTGIDIAKRIEDEYRFPFIFLTSNTDPLTINQAKKVMPSAYLVKPFTKDELYSSIEIALYRYKQQNEQLEQENIIVKDAIFLKDKGTFNKVLFNEIIYLKSAHVYVEVVLKNKNKIVVRSGLSELLSRLPERFLRVHRGYVVNAEYIRKIEGQTIKVKEEIIPVGQKYRQSLLNKINYI